MADRTAAEVMCCPGGTCRSAEFTNGACRAIGIAFLVRSLHAAGYMIVPREPTEAMLRAASMRQQPSLGKVYPSIYRAMTEAGELK
jgi:hypothetical protein